jgi:S-DNA-T family DNA segregation ATPase FtsK/SpoIIIE
MALRVSKFSPKSNLANWRQMMRASLIRSGALFGAAALGLFAIFYGLALLSYSAGDAAYNSAAADVQHNWMGQSGAYVADAMLFLFGVPAIFLLPLMLVFARRLWRDVPQPQWKRQLSLCLIGMLLVGFGMSYWQQGSDIGFPAGWGGLIALLLGNAASALISQIQGIFGTLLRVSLILGALAGGVALVIRSLQLERPLLRIPTLTMPKFGVANAGNLALAGDDLPAPQIVEPKLPRKAVEPDQRKPPVIEDRTLAPKKAAFSTGARQGDFFGSFTLPSLELLDLAVFDFSA